ncbi:MAG: hypothetical protein ACRDPF_36810 [Streptosporangiaceae bacterium]
MAAWHDGDRVDLVDEMFALTTTIALRALFCPWRAASLPPATAATTAPWPPGAPASATSSRITASPESAAVT